MKVADILKDKGSQVLTIKPNETIAACSRQLQMHRIGAMVVSQNGKTIDGIISERDIAYSLCERRGELHLLPVSALMARQVVACSPDDSLHVTALIMSQSRIRHLPVREGGQLVGIISMRDIVEFRLSEMKRRTAALEALVLADERDAS